MAKKLSKEEWEQRANDSGKGRCKFLRWSVDGEFGSAYRAVFLCDFCKSEWERTVNSMIHKSSECPKCSGSKIRTSGQAELDIESSGLVNFVSWPSGYKSLSSYAEVSCKIDGFKWISVAKSIISGSCGCHCCSGRFTYTPEERELQISSIDGICFVEWHDKALLYKNLYSRAVVRCSVDGFEWSATVHDLVNGGHGCPKCAKYGYDPSKTGTLYALRSECGKYVKVGISNKPKQRHRKLKMSTPFKFNIVEKFEGGGAKIAELEKYFHSKYERAGFTGFDGATEWLICSGELLGELRRVSIEHE